MSDIDTGSDSEDAGGGDLIKALPSILWARRWLIIIPAVLASIAGVAAAYLIPPKYRSQATILIESAQLPVDAANASVADAVEQRIERVRQRVLSRGDLIQLIRTNGLYPSEQRSKPLSEIVDEMRKATVIESIGADISSNPMRRGSDTVAFTISFTYPQPGPAQLVVQQFVNRFLELDASNQAEQAAGAANFLGEQAQSIQSRIRDIDNQITDIKMRNGTTLTLGQYTGSDSMGAMRSIDSEIDGLLGDNARLAGAAKTDTEVTSLRAQLRNLEARLSPTHPDVLALRSQVAAAERAASSQSGKTAEQIQIDSNNSRISALRSARAAASSQSAAVQSAAARAPAITAQIDQLEKQADNLRFQYQQLGGRLVNAETSARMESEQKGERFSVADPPVVPDKPYSPNRPMLALGGVAGGLALGLGLALAIELLLRPIRGVAALRSATGMLPLIVIPEIDPKPGRLHRLRDRWQRFRFRKTVSA
jgi:succinoglycan biosynthesis transport protein ExoP